MQGTDALRLDDARRKESSAIARWVTVKQVPHSKEVLLAAQTAVESRMRSEGVDFVTTGPEYKLNRLIVGYSAKKQRNARAVRRRNTATTATEQNAQLSHTGAGWPSRRWRVDRDQHLATHLDPTATTRSAAASRYMANQAHARSGSTPGVEPTGNLTS